MNWQQCGRSACLQGLGRLVGMFFLLTGAALAQTSDWTQWGGPNGNFKIEGERAGHFLARNRPASVVEP